MDGFHRCRAYLLVHGPDAEAEVEWRRYRNDADLFAEAAALNAAHGQPLSGLDIAHCIARARELGVKDEQLPQVLSLTAVKLEKIRGERYATGPDGQQVLLKRANRHLAGRTLTGDQVTGNSMSSGMNLTYHANQIINAIERNIAQVYDPAVTQTLGKLRNLLNGLPPRETPP